MPNSQKLCPYLCLIQIIIIWSVVLLNCRVTAMYYSFHCERTQFLTFAFVWSIKLFFWIKKMFIEINLEVILFNTILQFNCLTNNKWDIDGGIGVNFNFTWGNRYSFLIKYEVVEQLEASNYYMLVNIVTRQVLFFWRTLPVEIIRKRLKFLFENWRELKFWFAFQGLQMQLKYWWKQIQLVYVQFQGFRLESARNCPGISWTAFKKHLTCRFWNIIWTADTVQSNQYSGLFESSTSASFSLYYIILIKMVIIDVNYLRLIRAR